MEMEHELREHLVKSRKSFPYFLKHIFPLSFKKGQIKKAPHTWKWAKRLQDNTKTATLSARKHLKSTTIYAFVMWLIFRLERGDNKSWIYMSYNQKMSQYHTVNIKNLIRANPCFKGITDLNQGQSKIEYSWGGDRFTCIPSGILTFNRGWHGDGVICDDILADPTNELNFTLVEKITRSFMEQVMSLPREGGEIHLVGTAQHQMDLFFKLKENEGWNWAEYKAIVNEADKKVLWPELFSYERLCEIRDVEIGEKAFKKEYMCSPIWSEEAYFKRDELMKVVDKTLTQEKKPASEWLAPQRKVVAGLDIGKKTHPSHISVFVYWRGEYKQIYSFFMDGWDYSKQVDYINSLIEWFHIDELRYDDTRSELEGFRERGIIKSSIWKPIVFKTKIMFDMASNFSRLVNKGNIRLLSDQRMIDSVLSVNNELKAPESDMGHGDAFWSIALALYKTEGIKGYFAI